MKKGGNGFKVVLRLRDVRKNRSLTAWDVAIAANTYQTQISRLESGHVDPKLSTMVMIARGLGVGVDDLIDWAKTRKVIKEVERERKARGELNHGRDEEDCTPTDAPDSGDGLRGQATGEQGGECS